MLVGGYRAVFRRFSSRSLGYRVANPISPLQEEPLKTEAEELGRKTRLFSARKLCLAHKHISRKVVEHSRRTKQSGSDCNTESFTMGAEEGSFLVYFHCPENRSLAFLAASTRETTNFNLEFRWRWDGRGSGACAVSLNT